MLFVYWQDGGVKDVRKHDEVVFELRLEEW